MPPATRRVIGHQHPVGAGCLGDEAFGFRIIDAAQRGPSQLPRTDDGKADDPHLRPAARNAAIDWHSGNRMLCGFHDARPIAGRLTLDGEGLAIVEHRSAVEDLYDEDERKEQPIIKGSLTVGLGIA